ncbi:MAG: hypothetical protein LBD12_06340, partial [Clostridiales Family XIII bacterium]|nr:hypothetical protein [Clostridiales Family XIII bacterium]
MKRRYLAVILAVLLMVCAALAGCGGGGDSGDSADSGDSGAADEPAAETPPAAEGEWDFTDAPKVNLTFAIYLPETDATTKDLCRYLDLVKEYTEGTVDYTLYAGSTIAAGNEELDAVKNGLADVTFFPVAYGSGALPQSFLLEYPGIFFKNDFAASHAFNDWFKEMQP